MSLSSKLTKIKKKYFFKLLKFLMQLPNLASVVHVFVLKEEEEEEEEKEEEEEEKRL